ncbi:MAG TPA: aromatic aminobenezylarsenical efflux permease ArsG family transporter [Bacteroidales bacterium]|nr:aromatic aminobenezylarsenical efflux permease ArsG family transporter [Bacteroidales bacterium]
MSEFLNTLISNSTAPILTAALLGLMTAISPCPLATNITAVGYIGKDVENRRRVFYNGLFYTFGRLISYTLIAVIIVIGADQFKISGIFQRYGEKIIGPLLVLIGLIMLGVLKIKSSGRLITPGKKFTENQGNSYLGSMLLGVVFALAFCPYSGVLYFGMLIPLTISNPSGLLLPAVFAIATGIPVLIFAWLIAFTISGVGKLYKRVKVFEVWFRRIIAGVFIGVGVYYIIIIYF